MRARLQSLGLFVIAIGELWRSIAIFIKSEGQMKVTSSPHSLMIEECQFLEIEYTSCLNINQNPFERGSDAFGCWSNAEIRIVFQL